MQPSATAWPLPAVVSSPEPANCSDGATFVDSPKKLLTCVPQLEPYFSVVGRIGSGTFSEVYLARLKTTTTSPVQLDSGCDIDRTKEYAIKLVVPTSHPNRLVTELRCLLELGGNHNVIRCLFSVRHEDHVAIVMPYFPHNKFKELVQRATVNAVRDYMKNLLIALQHVHAAGIIHRDVKPTNFLFNMNTKKYALIDFGLAQRIEIKHILDGGADATLKTILNKRRTVVPSSQESPRKRRVLAELVAAHNARWSGSNFLAGSTIPALDSKVTLEQLLENPRCCLRVPKAATPTSPQRLSRKPAMSPEAQASLPACSCYGQPLVCDICTRRSVQQHAPRAGTSGFRPPEVLLRCTRQGTAVDMWAAGVILLSLISGRYPFFKAAEDMAALAQIAALLGADRLEACAEALGKRLTLRPRTAAPSSLAQLCSHLRCSTSYGGKACKKRRCEDVVWCLPLLEQATDSSAVQPQWPDSAIDLLEKLLEPEPDRRISATEALAHRFFQS